MFRRPLQNRSGQGIVLIASEEPQACIVFFSLSYQSSRIYRHFAVGDSLPIAKRDKRLVPIGCGCCFAIGVQPAIKFLWSDVSSRASAKRFQQDQLLGDVIPAGTIM